MTRWHKIIDLFSLNIEDCLSILLNLIYTCKSRSTQRAFARVLEGNIKLSISIRRNHTSLGTQTSDAT